MRKNIFVFVFTFAGRVLTCSPMFNLFNSNVVSAPYCEDAPCCGCCGQDRYEADYDYRDQSDARTWDEREEEEEQEEEEQEVHQGGEDRYLDSYWEDRFDCGGDY